MRFQLRTHMSPEIENIDGDDVIVGNGPVGTVVGEYEFAYPAAAVAARDALRADLHAAGIATERGYADLSATISWHLVGGGYAVILPV